MKELVPISVCLCTMDRPVELARCLKSIRSGSRLPAEIIVSDDSRTDATRLLCESMPDVIYTRGPQAGQGPNRQHGATACGQPWVTFIDDDAVLLPHFLALMADEIRRSDSKTILAGDLIEFGRRLSPTNLTFWGSFGAPAADGENEAVIFSASVFPRVLFDELAFDPRIRYGYEDSDLCSRALTCGYRIRRVPDALVEHMPSNVNRAASIVHREWARYYTSLKRHFLVRRRPVAGTTYLLLAPWHTAAAMVRRGQWSQLPGVARSYARAVYSFGGELLSRPSEKRAATNSPTRAKQASATHES